MAGAASRPPNRLLPGWNGGIGIRTGTVIFIDIDIPNPVADRLAAGLPGVARTRAHQNRPRAKARHDVSRRRNFQDPIVYGVPRYRQKSLCDRGIGRWPAVCRVEYSPRHRPALLLAGGHDARDDAALGADGRHRGPGDGVVPCVRPDRGGRRLETGCREAQPRVGALLPATNYRRRGDASRLECPTRKSAKL
jgi:hypothetical protein